MRARPRTVLAASVACGIVAYACAVLELRVKIPKDNWLGPMMVARQLGSLFNLVLLPLHLTLLIATGLAPLRWVLLRRKLAPHVLLPLAFIFASLTGYAVFWCYFLDCRFGQCASFAVLLLSFREIVMWRRAFRHPEPWLPRLGWTDTGLPLALMALVAAFYICALTAFQNNPPDYLEIASTRLLHRLPTDHAIPWIFSDRLFRGEDPRHIVTDWLSSDRPPLQAAIVLVQRPLRLLPGDNFIRQYQVLATLLQCLWVPAVWSLCRALRLPVRRAMLVVLACAASGFVFVNCIFVWPKFLAGSLFIFALTFLLPCLLQRKPLSPARASAAATAAMLGFLSHGGVAFTLIALLLLSLPLALRSIKSVVIASVAAILLYVPWSMYQKLYDPPGDRLLKWHLGGVEAPYEPRSVGQVLRDQYGKLTFESWSSSKWMNVRACLAMPEEWTTADVRSKQFFGLAAALGVLYFGLACAVIWPLLRGRSRAGSVQRWLLTLAVLSLGIWVLLLYEPGSTLNHQNSYATILLLFVVGAAALTRWPRRLFQLAFGLHLAIFSIAWLAETPNWEWKQRVTCLNAPMAVCALALFGLLLHFCLKGYRDIAWRTDSLHS